MLTPKLISLPVFTECTGSSQAAPVAQLVTLARSVLIRVLLGDLVVRPAVEDARVDLVQRLARHRGQVTSLSGASPDCLAQGRQQ